MRLGYLLIKIDQPLKFIVYKTSYLSIWFYGFMD